FPRTHGSLGDDRRCPIVRVRPADAADVRRRRLEVRRAGFGFERSAGRRLDIRDPIGDTPTAPFLSHPVLATIRQPDGTEGKVTSSSLWSPPMNLALFDFDGTITSNNTWTPFLKFAVRPSRMVVGRLLLLPVI